MLKKLTTMLTTASLTLSLAGNALAAFADLELIRVYYDRTGAEIATDLGSVSSLITSPSTTIAGSFGTLTTGYVVYFALDRTTNRLWASGSTATPSIITGSSLGLTGTKSGTTNMYSWYNGFVQGTTYTGLASEINSYKNKLSSTQGTLAGAITAGSRLNTEASLDNLISAASGSVTQNLYFWANGNTTVTAEKTGVPVATITTHFDGSTTISNQISDTFPPLVTIDTPPPTTSTSATVSVGFTATDAVGVASYLLSDNPTPPLLDDAGWVAITPAVSFSVTANYTFTGLVAGVNNKTLYVWSKDAAGNISIPKSSAVEITISSGDTTPPSVTITSPSPFTSATVDIAFTITDDTGVTGYQLTEAGTAPAASDANWIAVSPAATSFSGNATHTFSTLDPGASSLKTLYVWARDEAQNVSNADPTANVQVTILKPVRITGIAPPQDPYFMQLQDAFNAVVDGDSILAMGNTFTETVLNLNRPGASVTLKGGFDSGYTANTGGVSTLRGQLLISNGNLVTENLVIN